MAPISRNVVFEIFDANDRFTGLVMRKATVESVVMSLGDKITGDVYYKDNNLALTMQEYIIYNRIKYVLVNPPTVVREGMVSDNSELKGMTKYSFVFYHPMYQLTNIPFNDVAVSGSQSRYLSEKKIFSWIGNPNGFIAKVNANLSGTQWVAVKSSRFPNDKEDELSDVLTFNNQTIGDALKVFYDTWGVPYVIDKVDVTEPYYSQRKYFKIVFGLPSNEIYASAEDKQLGEPFVFRFGQDVGLKNNSRNPRNNKIITRISGYGAERNVPYGYPQIPWYGDERWEYTKYVNDDPMIDAGGVPHGTPASDAYPLYMGIVGGVYTKLIQHPFTRSFLMPSIYSQTVFNKVSPYVSGGSSNPNYNQNGALVDYYDAIASQQYPYPNEFNPQAPSYESHQFEDIYPELGTARIINAEPLNSNLQPADEWDDTMDDDGNYVQSYFQITLPPLSFDLYACAAITQEMEINMRSGACIGCTFPVEVDWDSYKANFYDEDGNFDPEIGTGHPRDPQKFPDSTSASIKIIVKKENSTFGTLMPNRYQNPAYNDEFVVLGISLPQSYITNAEQRLDEEMKSYMLENNVYYFDYPLKFDEYWLEKHEYVLSQIRPNSIIRFEYAGEQLSLYVKQMAIKYGENILPQYDITLTDNVDVVLNQVGRVAEDVEKLTSLISIIRENYNKSVWSEVAKKLSKVDDDTASGFIRFMKGLQVGSRFVSGLLGEGGVFRKNADGRTYLEVDEMYVRMKAYFDTVEIREYQHSHGGRIASSAGIKVSHVVKYGDLVDQETSSHTYVPLDDSGNYHSIDPDTGEEELIPLDTVFYRCYYRAKDGDNTTQNSFKVGDLARCHTVNAAQGLSMKDYWRAVVGINTYNTFYNDEYGWVDLCNTATVTIAPPYEPNSKTIVGYMDGSSIPEQGDDLFQLGNIFEQGRRGAIMENTTGENTPSYQVFQDIGLDSRPQEEQSTPFNPYTTDGKNYIDLGYDSGTGHAKLNVIGDAYIGDANENTYVKYVQRDSVTGQPKLTIKAIIDIASTLGNTNNTFQDLLNTIAGLGISIEDLQNQIDGAIETWFYDYLPVDPTSQTPTEPLINVVVEGQTVHCEPYYDWYTTDVAAGNNNERLKHLGDIFYDNSSGRAFRFSNSAATPSDPPHFIWVEIEDSAVIEALQKALEALGLADSKGKIYTTSNNVLPPPPYNVNDLWVNASGTFTYTDGGQQMSVTCNNDILKCIHARTSSESASITDWTLASKYTDDTMVEYYTNILTGVTQPSQSSEKEISLAAQNAIRNALGGKTILAGGLMLTSLIGLRQLTPNANPDLASSYITWAGISGEYVDRVTPDTQDPTAPYAKGHGIASWYGGNMVDKEMLSDAQIADGWDGSTYHLRWARGVDRFDGSGYRADGNISWDASGSLTLKNVTWGDSDIRNFFNSFAVGVVSDQLRITPKGDFTTLNVLSDIYIGGHLTYNDQTHTATISGGSPVATQTWVSNNYVEKTFFARLFQAYDANGVAIAPNEADDTTHIVNNIKAMVGFWTNQYLSALGQNPSQGGGGGGTGDVTWTALANPATGTPQHTIHQSYISGILNDYVTFSQMQAQGYATQGWVQQQGYVTSSGVTSITTGTGLTGGTITSSGTITVDTSVIATREWVGSGYLPLSGGTLTGNLFFKFGHDLTREDNGVTNTKYEGIKMFDKNGYYSAQLINQVQTNGTNALNFNLRNRNGNTEYDKSFILRMTKTGKISAYLDGNNVLTSSNSSVSKSGDTLTVKINDTTQSLTDTKNTAGTTDTSSKIFLIGATAQDAISQTYSQDTAYVGTDGHLYSNSKKVVNTDGGILENADGITYSVSNSTVISGNPTSLFQSPIPKYLWHDVFAFCRASTPAYYTTTDNVNWTAATLDKRFFAQKEANSTKIIDPTTGVTGSRWVWSSGIQYTMSRWMVVGLAYVNQQAHITIVVEKSSDGSTWTVLHSSSFHPSINPTPIWISIPSQLSTDANYLRLTITKDPQDTTGATAITSIKLLTSRWGDQGLGSEYEYPYNWDADGNIFSISDGTQNLGSSTKRWATFYGNVGDFYSDNAGLLKLKRKISSGAALIDYYPNNQETNYWRAGVGADLQYMFIYNNAQKVVITNTGSVGIGTSSPSYKLHVGGTFYASENSSIGGTLGVTGLLTASGGITIPSGKTLTIGDAVLSWDSENQAIKITKGLYSETFISALGANSSGGGGGGGTGDVTWTALENPATGTPPHTIHQSYIASILNDYVMFSQMQAQGYATQGWVQQQGYVTSSGVTSIAMTVPTGFSVTPTTAITGTGTFAINFATGYSLPTTAKQTNWDTAYTYSHTHSNKSVLDGITSTKVSTWDSALTSASISILTDVTLGTLASDDLLVYDATSPAHWKNVAKSTFLSSGISGTFWGRSWTNGGTVSGTLTGVLDVYLTGIIMLGSGSSGIYFERNSLNWHSNNSYQSSLMTFTSNSLQINQNLTMASGKTIKIGDAYLAWESDSNSLKVYKLDSGGNEVAANLYATGGVSALGYGSSGSGGGSGDVTWTALENPATDSHTIHASYISSTLASYAQQSWVTSNYYISNGTIYMNGQSISPSLGNYLPLAGGVMTGAIKRFYPSASDDPVINIASSDKDVWIWRVSSSTLATSAGYGFGLKYIGTGSGNNNSLGLFSDNQNGTQVAALTIQQDGTTTFAVTPKVGTNNVITAGTIGSQSVNYAASAGSVSWANVSSKPSAAGDATTPVYWTGSGFTTCTAYSSASVNYAATAGTANMIANNITVTVTVTSDNGINFNNGTRHIFFGNGSSGNSGIYTPTEGWVMGISPSGSVFLNGNAASATTASKLSTVSKTAWGQTYWTSDGVPDTISGAMTGVTTINNQLKIGESRNTRLNIAEQSATIDGVHIFVESLSSSYTNERPLILQYGYGNVGIGVTQPAYKLDVSGDVRATNFRGALIGNADTATSATNAGNADTVDNEHASAFVHITGSTMSGNLTVSKAAGSEPRIGVYQEGYPPIYLTSGSSSKNRGLYCSELGWLCGWDSNNNGFFNGNATSATTATKLATSRTINGTSFDGSANITTENWGTARNVSIADSDSTNTGSAVSVNGSAAVTLNLPATIKATLTGNASSATKLQNSRSLWGNTFDGTGNVNNNIYIDTGSNDRYIHFRYDNNNYAGASWRLISRGSGSSDTNYFDVETGGSSTSSNTWYRVVRLTMDNRYVGIGTDSPSYKLHVDGTFYASGNSSIGGTLSVTGKVTTNGNFKGNSIADESVFYVGNSVNAIGSGNSAVVWAYGNRSIDMYTNSAIRMTVTGSGSVGIGTASPAYKLDVNGDARCQNLYSSSTGNVNGFNGMEMHYNSTSGHGGGIFFHWNGVTNYSSAYIYHDADNHINIYGDAAGFGVRVGSNNGDYIQIGDVRLVYEYDSSTGGKSLKVVAGNGSSAANLYATGGISALGANTSGGSGNVGDVTWTALAVTATNSRHIDASYINGQDVEFDYIIANEPILARDGMYATGDVTIGGNATIEGNTIVKGYLSLWENISASGYITTEDYIEAEGTITTHSGFVNSSDARKKDVLDYDANIDVYTLAYAPAIHFRWNNKPDYNIHVGTIAQYWQGVMPEVVSTDKNGYLSMQYDVLALLASISVAKKVVDHERRIMELEEENAYLKYEINQLKKVA